MLGRGGRWHGAPPGRIDGDPASVGPQSDVAAWFEQQNAGVPALAESVPSSVPPGYETVVCKPAGYWSLSVLPSLDSVLIRRLFGASYVATGLNDIIPPGWTVSNGRVMIVTGYCFQALVPGIGGVSSSLGVSAYAPDIVASGAIELQFVVPGGPIETHQPTGTGGKGGASEFGGFGTFNYGMDKGECPVEIYIPGGAAVKAQYREFAAPIMTPVTMLFRMQGYEVPAHQFYAAVIGSRK